MPRQTQRKGSPRKPHPQAFHSTPAEGVDRLLRVEAFAAPIGEFACGEGHISRVLESDGDAVISTDLIDRGYGQGGVDFLASPSPHADLGFCSLLTNPPFPLFTAWVERSLELLDARGWPSQGNKQAGCALLAPVTYLAGQERGVMFCKRPPANVWVFSARILCVQGGSQGKITGQGTMDYLWLVWRAPWQMPSHQPLLGWL
jgi:hypothetical protein